MKKNWIYIFETNFSIMEGIYRGELNGFWFWEPLLFDSSESCFPTVRSADVLWTQPIMENSPRLTEYAYLQERDKRLH